MLAALQDKVLVIPDAEAEQAVSIGGILMPGTHNKLVRGEVFSVGAFATRLCSGDAPGQDVSPGAVVLYEHSKGWDVYDDGKRLVMLPQEAVVAVVRT